MKNITTKRQKYVLALCLLMFLCRVSLAQQTHQKFEEQVLVKVDTDVVAVDVTVTDPQGNYLLDLKREDFELLEDGVAHSIEFFQPVRTLQQAPLALVIALDISGSLSSQEIEMQHDAMVQFINMLDSNTSCALLGFNHEVDVLQDFTSDHKKLAKKLPRIKDYGG